MPIYSLKLPFLQISPKVWADENHLYARTSIFYRILNLFFYSRTVVADRTKKHIEIRIKTLWLFTSKKYIAFNDIEYIDIARREESRFVIGQSGGSSFETWYVQVIKKNRPYREELFTFSGDGGGEDTSLYIKWVDFVGMQYEKALNYAELVSKYTESPLGKDNKIEYTIKVDQYRCLNCGHLSPSKTKCIYCDSSEMEKVD